MTTYRIVRHYARGTLGGATKQTIKRGLTFEEAITHCGSPEAASRTATKWRHRQRTKRVGPWFDGYETERGLFNGV